VLFKDEEIDEKEWLNFANESGTFDFLNHPAEDIYTMEEVRKITVEELNKLGK
jgi:hypothetical protein